MFLISYTIKSIIY